VADRPRLVNVRQVTWGIKTHEHPVFSPDGKRIAYYAGTYGWLQLHVSAADGTGERPLTCDRGNHTQAAWSPDGRHVWYRAQAANDAPWEVWRVAVDDPKDRVRFLAHRKVSFKHPSVSPDGRELLWFSDQGSPKRFAIWRGRIARDGIRGAARITHAKDRNDCHPVWSDDGRRMAFHAYMGAVEATVTHLFVADADGRNERRVTSRDAQHKHPFFVGRDHLVHHTKTPDGRRFLALTRTDGGGTVAITNGKRKDKHPSPWLPARGPARIAFASKRRGIDLPPEKNPTYDVFWGHLEGVPVRRAGKA
jgi:Tol biopolymer transport system component